MDRKAKEQRMAIERILKRMTSLIYSKHVCLEMISKAETSLLS